MTSTTHRTPESSTFDGVSTTELVGRGLDEAKELLRAEIALARAEAMSDLHAATRAAIAFGGAAALAIVGITVLVVALVLALGASPLLAVSIGAGLSGVGGVLAATGYAAMPRAPLEKTRAHLARDVQRLKEHAA